MDTEQVCLYVQRVSLRQLNYHHIASMSWLPGTWPGCDHPQAHAHLLHMGGLQFAVMDTKSNVLTLGDHLTVQDQLRQETLDDRGLP